MSDARAEYCLRPAPITSTILKSEDAYTDEANMADIATRFHPRLRTQPYLDRERERAAMSEDVESDGGMPSHTYKDVRVYADR